MKYLIVLIALMISIHSGQLAGQNYAIDESHSAVLMKVQRFGVVHVIGRFGDIEGTVFFSPEDATATTASISVAVNSYSANNSGGEASAIGPAFLDGENHPRLELVFKESVEVEGRLKVRADLTIRGVTKEVEFFARVTGPKMDPPTGKLSIALSGVINIQRLDYGVGPDRTLPDGTEIIGNDVSIMMEFLALAE